MRILGFRHISFGNYILYSLVALAVCGLLASAESAFAARTKDGGGLVATNIYKSGKSILYGLRIRGSANIETPAFIKASVKNFKSRCSGPPIKSPNVGVPSVSHEFAPPRPLFTPASLNIFAISPAYMNASASDRSNSIKTWSDAVLSRIASAIWRHCSGEICRHAVMRSISAVRSCAAAASFSSVAARSIASSTRLFDRVRSSVCMRLSQMPNATSPTIPTAVPASVNRESNRNVLYGGSTSEITNDAATEIITRAPNPIAHHSLEEDASSSWFSAVFIRPFGKNQAGKNGFRTLLFAMVFWSLIYVILFWGISYL